MFISGALKLGGGQRQLMHLINLLNRKKFQISLYLFKNSGEHIKDLHSDIRLLTNYYKVPDNFYNQIKLTRKIIIKESPDIIYTNLAGTNIPALIAQRFIPKKLRAKHVVSVVNNPEKYSSSNIWMLNHLLPFADKIVACAEGVNNYIKSNFRVSYEKVLTINNSVDLELAKKQSKKSIDHPWFNQRDPLLITVARLAKQKGCDVLIKAFGVINEILPCNLIIIGDGPERKDLELLAEDLKVKNRIDFLGFCEDSNAYIKNSDIFILSSRWEGMATVIIEAAAVNTPIIATDAPYGSSDLIKDGFTGFLVPVDDYKNLAIKIKKLLDNKSMSKSFIKNAHKMIKHNFDANIMVSKYEKIFMSTVS